MYFNVSKKTPELEEKINAIVDEYPGVEVRDEDGLVEEADDNAPRLSMLLSAAVWEVAKSLGNHRKPSCCTMH